MDLIYPSGIHLPVLDVPGEDASTLTIDDDQAQRDKRQHEIS